MRFNFSFLLSFNPYCASHYIWCAKTSQANSMNCARLVGSLDFCNYIRDREVTIHIVNLQTWCRYNLESGLFSQCAVSNTISRLSYLHISLVFESRVFSCIALDVERVLETLSGWSILTYAGVHWVYAYSAHRVHYVIIYGVNFNTWHTLSIACIWCFF